MGQDSRLSFFLNILPVVLGDLRLTILFIILLSFTTDMENKIILEVEAAILANSSSLLAISNTLSELDW